MDSSDYPIKVYVDRSTTLPDHQKAAFDKVKTDDGQIAYKVRFSLTTTPIFVRISHFPCGSLLPKHAFAPLVDKEADGALGAHFYTIMSPSPSESTFSRSFLLYLIQN